jgi:UvrD/REP helicase N-terminal domain
VLVDEFQDLKPAQELMVRIVAAPQDSVLTVGDEDQTLSAWRRASVERIVALDQAFRRHLRAAWGRSASPRSISIRGADTALESCSPRRSAMRSSPSAARWSSLASWRADRRVPDSDEQGAGFRHRRVVDDAPRKSCSRRTKSV